jgi:phosphomannomutase
MLRFWAMTGRANIRFGTSGWRAVLADQFTFANARRAVAALAEVLSGAATGARALLIGYDTRFLADRFAEEAAWLLAARGFEPRLASRPVPTPVLAFEIARQRALGGINFTASHNPPIYLGLKYSTADGAPALPELTGKVEKAAARLSDVPEPARGEIARFDPAPPYLEDLARKIDTGAIGNAALGCAIDFRYGTSAGFLDTFLERAGARIDRLHAQRDPLFGGLSPQCGERELAELSHRVAEAPGQWIGLATDGDADRFGVLDADGSYVPPNTVLALLARERLARGKKEGIARSVATTHALDALAAKYGVPLYETPVGFKYIGELLLEGKIGFGGEESAGLTIAGHVPEKDGILACALAAELAASRGKTFQKLADELWAEIGPFVSRRIDLPLSEEARERLAKLRAAPPKDFAGRTIERVNAIDGVKLLFSDHAWLLIRESGTEPVARVYVEARSAEEVDRLAEAGRGFLCS